MRVEVPLEVELARVTPVLAQLGRRLKVPISIDTRRAEVARIALESGAAIINDITALDHDPEMAPLAARTKCAVVLMHMRGGPQIISSSRATATSCARSSTTSTRARDSPPPPASRARELSSIPGLGFAKTAQHNLKLLAALPDLRALGYPVLVGASRKTFVSRLSGAGERDLEFGTAAANALAIAAGASIVRVHDVGAARRGGRMAAAIAGRNQRFRRDA